MADGVVNLSPGMRAKTGIWSAEPIVKGSSSMYLLLRRAREIAGSAADGDSATLAFIGDAVLEAGIIDAYDSLGLAVRFLTVVSGGCAEPGPSRTTGSMSIRTGRFFTGTVETRVTGAAEFPMAPEPSSRRRGLASQGARP